MTRKPDLVGFNFLKSDSLYFFSGNLSISDISQFYLGSDSIMKKGRRFKRSESLILF